MFGSRTSFRVGCVWIGWANKHHSEPKLFCVTSKARLFAIQSPLDVSKKDGKTRKVETTMVTLRQWNMAMENPPRLNEFPIKESTISRGFPIHFPSLSQAMRLLLLLDLLGDELFQAWDPTIRARSRSIQIPSSQATFIQLWFDLGIKTQCASKHQRSIQVIPEVRKKNPRWLSFWCQPKDWIGPEAGVCDKDCLLIFDARCPAFLLLVTTGSILSYKNQHHQGSTEQGERRPIDCVWLMVPNHLEKTCLPMGIIPCDGIHQPSM